MHVTGQGTHTGRASATRTLIASGRSWKFSRSFKVSLVRDTDTKNGYNNELDEALHAKVPCLKGASSVFMN